MFGFIIGAVVGLLFLMIDSSILVGLNIAEILFAIIWIIIIYGCFGALMDFIIQIIQKIKIKRRR